VGIPHQIDYLKNKKNISSKTRIFGVFYYRMKFKSKLSFNLHWKVVSTIPGEMPKANVFK
jgi:hypothetical protein